MTNYLISKTLDLKNVFNIISLRIILCALPASKYVCALGAHRGQKRMLILWTTTWVPRIEPRSSGRAAMLLISKATTLQS